MAKNSSFTLEWNKFQIFTQKKVKYIPGDDEEKKLQSKKNRIHGKTVYKPNSIILAEDEEIFYWKLLITFFFFFSFIYDLHVFLPPPFLLLLLLYIVIFFYFLFFSKTQNEMNFIVKELNLNYDFLFDTFVYL